MGDVDITYILPSSSGSENTGNDAKGSKKGSGIIPQLQHCVLITVFLWQAKTSLNCKHINLQANLLVWQRRLLLLLVGACNFLFMVELSCTLLYNSKMFVSPPFIDMKKSLLTCGACWTGEGLETEGCFNWDQMRTFLSR